MEKRDVIIIGAGPAGATTATILAQMGHDVLLLDKDNFPRDKPCGDAVPAGAVNILLGLGMADKIKAAITAQHWYAVNMLRLVSPGGYVLEANLLPDQRGTQAYIAPRFHFDALIKDYAITSGAEFRSGWVKEVVLDQGGPGEPGRVKGVRADINGHLRTIRAKLVIGADGVTSILTRKLSWPAHHNRHRSIAVRAYIDDLQTLPRQVELYLFKSILPGGYAWIFPLGHNRANIGLGLRLDKFRQQKTNLKNVLQQFLQQPAFKKRLQQGGQLSNIATWPLNLGSQKNLRRAFGGAMVVGDAAGLINPLTGGGIHNALISAQLAAEIGHQALLKGDVSYRALQAYEQRCRSRLWPEMRRAYGWQQLFAHYPVIIDLLARWMGGSNNFAQIFMKKL